ncbi:glutaredoxin family protein [Sutcliffiella halmapala]
MITFYTMDGCQRCYSVKAHLEHYQIPFIEKNILEVPQAAQELQEIIGEVTVPVVLTARSIYKGRTLLSLLQQISFLNPTR